MLIGSIAVQGTPPCFSQSGAPGMQGQRCNWAPDLIATYGCATGKLLVLRHLFLISALYVWSGLEVQGSEVLQSLINFTVQFV